MNHGITIENHPSGKMGEVYFGDILIAVIWYRDRMITVTYRWAFQHFGVESFERRGDINQQIKYKILLKADLMKALLNELVNTMKEE